MINYSRFTLDNGLKVIFHEDRSTPLVCLNILYNVGARDEDPQRTGFAHLFEHLMFGGSVNIPTFDEPLQRVGGENNAFTNNDITNYYVTLPADNMETAFWLESDRMLQLAFSDKSLEVQRNVVIEEFKQRYLNQPYGDVWLLLRPLAYKVHPYQWPTIGKDISHIEEATMADVKDFFYKHYAPNNAIMVVAGNTSLEQVKELTTKWFGDIEKRNVPVRKLTNEPVQEQKRTLTVERKVPVDSIYKVYHMPARADQRFHTVDLLSDLLSNGRSSRFYSTLIKEKKLFSEVHAYVSGDMDPGLFVVSGKLSPGVTFDQAEASIDEELEKIKKDLVTDLELQKVKNKVESVHVFGETNVLNKAMNLAYFELLGDASLINKEVEKYSKVSAEDIRSTAQAILQDNRSSVLYYKALKK
jgi:zinc protease